jgi:hypothetical protein
MRDNEIIDPYKFTKDVREAFLELLRKGNSRTAAMNACDISRYTLYNHMKADAEFKQAVSDAEVDAIDIVEDALFEKCMRGNTTAIVFFLKCRRGKKWNDKLKESYGDSFSREELEQRIEQLIEIAVRRLPEAERIGFINDLRSVAGLGEGDRQSIEAPDPAAD